MRALYRAFSLSAAVLVPACSASPAPAPAPMPPAANVSLPAPHAEALPAAPPLPRRSAGLQVVFDLRKSKIAASLGDPTLALYPLRGRTIVALLDVLFYVDGDALRSDPALQRGLSDLPRPQNESVDVSAMGGYWPDAAWLQVTYTGTRSFRGTFLRYRGAQWVDAANGDVGRSGRILSLAGDWSVAFLNGPGPYPDPGWPKSLVLLHPRWGVPIDLHATADDITALPDGSLYLARDGRVDLWAPNGRRLPLPQPAYGTTNPIPVTSSIVVSAPTAIWLLNRLNNDLVAGQDLPSSPDPPRPAHQLLRFDGKAWQVEPTPIPRPDRILAGPRGALWVRQGEELYERAADGTWAALDAPAPPDKVWVAADDDVWATSGGKLLLHTRPLPAGVDLDKLAPHPALHRYDYGCSTLTALLDEVPRTAPADFDFRARLAALAPAMGKVAGHFAFYDITTYGERRLAAYLPFASDDEAESAAEHRAADALVAVAKKHGATSARLVCLHLPDGADSARLVRDVAPPSAPRRATTAPLPPPLAGCATPLVVLFSPARTAPADFDFPLTRRALRGHTELSGLGFFDFQRGGRRVIAASASNPRQAQALLEVVRRSVPGAAPVPVCERPPAGAREIRVDVATGDVRK